MSDCQHCSGEVPDPRLQSEDGRVWHEGCGPSMAGDYAELVERLVDAAREVERDLHNGSVNHFAVSNEELNAAKAALQQRLAEVEGALRDIANAVRMGAESDLVAWANLATACQQAARTALKGETPDAEG